MTQQDTQSGLYLPSTLIDEMAEERALELTRAHLASVNIPVSFILLGF